MGSGCISDPIRRSFDENYGCVMPQVIYIYDKSISGWTCQHDANMHSAQNFNVKLRIQPIGAG